MVGESTPNLGLYVKGEKGPPRGLGAKWGDHFEDFCFTNSPWALSNLSWIKISSTKKKEQTESLSITVTFISTKK